MLRVGRVYLYTLWCSLVFGTQAARLMFRATSENIERIRRQNRTLGELGGRVLARMNNAC